jgi:hypothetical protein
MSRWMQRVDGYQLDPCWSLDWSLFNVSLWEWYCSWLEMCKGLYVIRSDCFVDFAFCWWRYMKICRIALSTFKMRHWKELTGELFIIISRTNMNVASSQAKIFPHSHGKNVMFLSLHFKSWFVTGIMVWLYINRIKMCLIINFFSFECGNRKN